jgi:hypothetical protein
LFPGFSRRTAPSQKLTRTQGRVLTLRYPARKKQYASTAKAGPAKGVFEVVISNRRKGQSPPAKPPGISALKVNPNRRILVVRDEPTTERIDVTKTIERINKRIEAANKPFRRVAIYGRKGGI